MAERERVPVVGPMAQPLKSLFFCEYHSIIIRSSTEKDIQIRLKEKLKHKIFFFPSFFLSFFLTSDSPFEVSLRSG